MNKYSFNRGGLWEEMKKRTLNKEKRLSKK